MDPEEILVVLGEKTRLRTRKNCAWVHLDVLDADGKRHKRWVPFTGVVDVALIPRYPKRSPERISPAASKASGHLDSGTAQT